MFWHPAESLEPIVFVDDVGGVGENTHVLVLEGYLFWSGLYLEADDFLEGFEAEDRELVLGSGDVEGKGFGVETEARGGLRLDLV